MILVERRSAGNEPIIIPDGNESNHKSQHDGFIAPLHAPATKNTVHTSGTAKKQSPPHFTPVTNHTIGTHTITSNMHTPPHITPANHTTGTRTITSHTRKPLPITPSAIHNTYTNMQNTFTPPPQSFHVDPYKDSLTPLSRPMSHGPAKTFTQELLDNDFDDFDDLSLGHPSAANHHNEVGRNWESFSAHFTQEFEWLKGEVDSLRNDVKSLRRTVRELKVRNFF